MPKWISTGTTEVIGQKASPLYYELPEGVTQRFVAQRIQLAYLAPDIMKRIIEGDVPNTLTLESFKNRQIPLDWRE